MKTPRKPRTFSELTKASRLLWYEYAMFRDTAVILMNGDLSDQKFKKAIIIESFLIHVRILLEFYYPTKPYTNDIIVSDFYDNNIYCLSNIGNISDFLKEERNRIHKNLAHLTYDRLEMNDETNDWNVKDIYNEVKKIHDRFLRSISKDKIDSIWENFS